MDIDLALLVGGITGIGGALVAAYYGRKNTQLDRERRRITWDELRIACHELRKSVDLKFCPSAILAVDRWGATIVNMLFDPDENVLMYVCVSEEKRSESLPSKPKDCEPVTTTKYVLHIPTSLLKEKQRKLLVVSSIALTGDSFTHILSFLVSQGFAPEKVKTLAAVCTDAAFQSEKGPNFFWFRTPYTEFYLPWGKAR